MNDSLMPGKGSEDFFQTGGTLKADAPCYIVRSADAELYQNVIAGIYTYVLTPRQMGKSSLMTRTADRLRKEDVSVAVLDLTGIGGDAGSMSADAWYYGLAHNILRELNISIALAEWWQEQSMLPPLNRLMNFFQDVVLTCLEGRIVMFVDEIDTTINLPFSDDFFAAIRACFNTRAKSKEFDRLCFVLLGVASPADLIRDPNRTPFNIGRRIDLSDFNNDEAMLFVRGLHNEAAVAQRFLKRLLYWTNGHPYLTQKLCALVHTEAIRDETPEAFVDRIIKAEFLGEGNRTKEDNLKLIDNRITQSKAGATALLKVYAKVRKGKKIQDQPQSAIHAALKLSGLIKTNEKGLLVLRNRIYQRVFDARWINRNKPKHWKQRTAFGSVITLAAVFSWWIGAQQLSMQSGADIIFAWLGISYPERVMVKIPAGSFLMGSPKNEKQRYVNEGPQHRVTFEQPFYLGEHEVTFDEYDVFVFLQNEDDACFDSQGIRYTVSLPFDENWGRGKRPVINVNWYDAHCYAQWLSRKTGKNYRLPTEAEWEYAARAGTTTPFSFGENITPEQVNYNGNFPYADGKKGLYRKKTVPVKSLPANSLGLYEVHGNVWEWCQDWYGEYKPEASINPSGPENGLARVLRGGSWRSSGGRTRSADRLRSGPDYGSYDIGFRLALGQENVFSKIKQ